MDWDKAITWADSLNSSATGGEPTGWRLPTMIDPDAAGDPVGPGNGYTGGKDGGHNVRTKSGHKTQYERTIA